VLPFAKQELKAKVAGSRKLTEITKLAKCGPAAAVAFVRLCFTTSLVCIACQE
jgi:hypothetical protein